MKRKIKSILQGFKGKRVGVFVDNANWFYPQKELGWNVDFNRLRKFLSGHLKIKVLKLYAGEPLDARQQERFNKFAGILKSIGFKVETKSLKKIWLNKKKSKFIYKCNFDVEIALDVARYIDKLDVVMIGSGDSDFIAIRKFTLENKKAFIALCFEKGVAWEIRKGYHIFLEDLRFELGKKKKSKKAPP